MYFSTSSSSSVILSFFHSSFIFVLFYFTSFCCCVFFYFFSSSFFFLSSSSPLYSFFGSNIFARINTLIYIIIMFQAVNTESTWTYIPKAISFKSNGKALALAQHTHTLTRPQSNMYERRGVVRQTFSTYTHSTAIIHFNLYIIQNVQSDTHAIVELCVCLCLCDMFGRLYAPYYRHLFHASVRKLH